MIMCAELNKPVDSYDWIGLLCIRFFYHRRFYIGYNELLDIKKIIKIKTFSTYISYCGHQ